MVARKKREKRFFTITTPRKDGKILEQFLDEFGYKAFEKEERVEDTRRSVLQISNNEELIAEISDFCKENKCTIQLIYIRNKQLVKQSFQSEKIYTPKPYGNCLGQKIKEEIIKKPKTEIDNFIDKKSSSSNNFKRKSSLISNKQKNKRYFSNK